MTKMRKMRDRRNAICLLAEKNREWMYEANGRRNFHADGSTVALRSRILATRAAGELVGI